MGTDSTPVQPSLASLSELFQKSGDAIFGVDATQRLLFLNGRAEDLLGVPRAEVLGRHCYDVIGGTDCAGRCTCRQDCATISFTRRGEPVVDYDVLIQPEAAPRAWVNVGIISVQPSDLDQPIAVHIARDLTSRRELRPSPPAELDQARLTLREIEVLGLLAKGATVRQIAEDLVVTKTTVRSHVQNLMAKLGVHTRLQAVVRARELDLL